MRSQSFLKIDPEVIEVSRISLSDKDNISNHKRFITDRLILFCQGDSEFRFTDRILRPQTGSVLFIPAMESYTTFFHGNQDLLQIFFCFHPQANNSISAKTQYMEKKTTPFPPPNPIAFSDNALFSKPFCSVNIWDVREKALFFQQEYIRQPYGYELRLKAQLLELLILLCRTEAVHTSESRVAEEILSYIMNHCEENLDRDELSRIFHYHPGHINRLIQAATGMTLHQYILRIRIRRAQTLLSTTNYPITQIAGQLRFYDSSHFSAVFQRITGMSPSAYRQMGQLVK